MAAELAQATSLQRVGKYELTERIGRGGMAEVWKARIVGPRGFERTVVLKRVLPHLAEDPSFAEMFIREARLTARLSHPNIVQVYEFGDAAGEYFLAMEYVQGHDLVSVMQAHLGKGRPAPGLGAFVVRELCRALAYAYDLLDETGAPRRIIHRDVTPSNILLSVNGGVKLLDFGIAKSLADVSALHTETGTLKGKLGYMAPEVFEGRPFSHRADLFAAGVVLHELLTGRRLFKGEGDPQTIALVRLAKVDPPSQTNPGVPPELDRIALRALAREPEDRYRDCAEMAVELNVLVQQLGWGTERVEELMTGLFPDEPTAPKRPSAPEDVRRGRWPVVAAIGGGVAIAAALTLSVMWPRPTASSPQTTAAPEAVATPAPSPPTLPPEIHLWVSSTPTGAAVAIDGQPTTRGRTPLELTLARGREPVHVKVHLSGYQASETELIPDADSRLQLTLSPLSVPPRSARPARAKRATHDRDDEPLDVKAGDVVDPFATKSRPGGR